MSRSLAPLLLLLAGCALPLASDRPARTGPDWQPWTAATFAKAKAEGRLIYVNVAAGWCHWCHVMDAETLRDPEVLDELDRRWVAIRVDADARPDLAERWLDWGWPANALLTPDARRLAERRGYQPPRDLAALLRRLADAHAAGTLVAEPPGAAPATRTPPDLVAALSAARAQLDAAFDETGPAWGKVAQRYPLAAPIEHAFLRAALRPAEAAWRERALQVLRAEWQLIDAVDGGMFQYSDDGTWGGGVHFEKIAPVNAGALEAFALAARVDGDAAWLAAARDVARWVTTTLRRPDGAFGASQDADPPGARGADFYRLDAAARRRVTPPRVDDRAYAGMNGLLAAGLARLSMASGDPAFAVAGARALERVLDTHAVPSGGLRHEEPFRLGGGPAAWDPHDGGDVLHLADQAGAAWGCLALHEATGEPRWLHAALGLGRVLLDRLEDRERGGFFACTVDPAATGDLAERRRPLRENALAARVLLLLEAHTGDATWGRAARRALLACAPDAPSWGRLVGEYVVALEEALLAPLELKVHARPGDPRAAPLLAAARRAWVPRLALKVEPGGAPGAFVCGAGACSAPITDPAALQAALERFAASVR